MPVLTKINTNVIADNAVTAAKIPAGAVDSDIGVGSVTASHIAANAVGSSEIADDAVLPANISHLGDGAGNLSGTLTGEQLRFGTTFTLDDNLTVNGDVTLAKVGDDSTGQTLTHTASTARTITGTGTLRMGSSLSSVDGMTGTLGSVVTGSPALNLGNFTGVLPVGVTGGSGLDAVPLKVLQIVYDSDSAQYSSTTAAWNTKMTSLSVVITPASSSSKILLFGQTGIATEGAANSAMIDFYKNATGFTETYNLTADTQGFGYLRAAGGNLYSQTFISMVDTANTGNPITYSIGFRGDNSSAIYISSTNQLSTLMAMEVILV